MTGKIDLKPRVTAHEAAIPMPVAKTEPREIARLQREKDTISSAEDNNYSLTEDIRLADEQLTEELNKERVDLVRVVKQMGKVQAMLARLTVETYGQSITRNSEELNEIIVKLASTYKSRNITWIITGASFTINVFAAAAGLNFMGKTFQAGAQMFGGVGTAIQQFAKFFEEDQTAQRTLLEFIRDENNRWMNSNQSTKQISQQELKEALQMAQKAEESQSNAIQR